MKTDTFLLKDKVSLSSHNVFQRSELLRFHRKFINFSNYFQSDSDNHHHVRVISLSPFWFSQDSFYKNPSLLYYWFSRMQQNRLFISISLHQNLSAGDGGHGPNALFTTETLTPKAPSEREEHGNSHSSSQEPCCVWLPCLLQSQFSLSCCDL